MTLTNDHYVPQFYLRHFASRSKSGQSYIWAFDRDGNAYEPNIRNVASQRGFNRATDKDTLEPTGAVEDMFTEVEGMIAPIVAYAVTSGLPTGAALSKLKQYMCLAYLRTSNFRNEMVRLHIEALKTMAVSSAANKEDFKGILAEAIPGHGMSDEEIEGYRSAALDIDKAFEIKLEQYDEYFLKTSLDYFTHLAPLFDARKAILLTAPKGSSFITSDNPVIKIPYSEGLYAGGLVSSGMAMSLDPNHCLLLVGEECRLNTSVVSAYQAEMINRCIMHSAERSVFSSKKDDELKKFFITTERPHNSHVRMGGGGSVIFGLQQHSIPILFEEIFPSTLF